MVVFEALMTDEPWVEWRAVVKVGLREFFLADMLVALMAFSRAVSMDSEMGFL